MLPALLFGVLVVLGPLALDDGGWTTLAIAAVFFAAGLVEAVLNPALGRFSDRRGRLLPIRAALVVSIVVGVALAAAHASLCWSQSSSSQGFSASEGCTRRGCRSHRIGPRPSAWRRDSRSGS